MRKIYFMIVWFAVANSLYALDGPNNEFLEERSLLPLRGLKKLFLLVRIQQPPNTKIPLTEKEIYKEFVPELKQVGLDVITPDDKERHKEELAILKSGGNMTPTLELEAVYGYSENEGETALAVDISLKEMVRPERGDASIYATTFRVPAAPMVTQINDKVLSKGAVSFQTLAFLNAFRKANDIASPPLKVTKETEKMKLELEMKMAKEGNADMQFLLGRRYLSGLGVKADGILGLKWLEQAALNGSPDAQCLLGTFPPLEKNKTVWVTIYSFQLLCAMRNRREELALENKKMIAEYEAVLTPEQKIEGKKLADSWTKANEAE